MNTAREAGRDDYVLLHLAEIDGVITGGAEPSRPRR
jgi:hypothetical protein